MSEDDLTYMRQALALAERGEGFVHPNPLVGAVLVKEGRVIGQGWHERYGGPHAERNALDAREADARGATMYVTLEPCCHHGKTPPCAEAIVEAGIARVVVAMEDPNPVVAGRGIERLRAAGIAVEVGTGEREARELNRVFVKYITTRRPWVTLKVAMTLDGKIATRRGDARWVSGEASRRLVHEERARHMAVMTGIGTVLADDPLLTARVEGRTTRQPTRVVVDSGARLPLDGALAGTTGVSPVVVAHVTGAPAGRVEALRRAGVECLACAGEEGRVDVADLLRGLGEAGIDSVLLEAGGELNASFLSRGLVDEMIVFVAPKIVGGNEAKTPVGGTGVEWMREALELTGARACHVGQDIMIRGFFKR